MALLRDVVDDLFTCLGPLRACEEPVQDCVVDPIECVIDPIRKDCIDPLTATIEAYPLYCMCGHSWLPSLPQNDPECEQDARAEQLKRTRRDYQYNYDLVRTFKVYETPDGQKVGKQGVGIAVADSVPFAQLPSLCWVIAAVRNALLIIDNLLAVLDLVLDEQRRARSRRTLSANPDHVEEGEHEPDITTVTYDDVDPDDLECKRREIEELRKNLTGTLTWARRVTYHASGAQHPPSERPRKAAKPPQEHDENQCACVRCSPQNVTRELVADLEQDLSNIVHHMLTLPELDRHPLSIKAYNDLFQEIPLPGFAHWFRNDELFALQRVAGQNPQVIQRVQWWSEWESRFPVTEKQYKAVMGEDDSLTDASADGRLYVCDYAYSIANTVAGDFPPDVGGQKYLYPALGLFALDKGDRRNIKAVAIQCQQEPGPENPVITPSDGWNWEIAKTIFQNADDNDSEYWHHLGLAHLLTEAFILTTYRTLPRQHPLYLLLTPHYQGTIFTNHTAVTSINQEGSYLNITEAIFSGTVPSTLGIAANSVHECNFKENTLRAQLAKRGVDDPALFPNYPYREDALLIWDAIERWVDSYINVYYTCDRDVREDYELQNWVAELGSFDGARIKGVGTDGRIETINELVEIVTQVIYNASTQHALSNFPLQEYEIYSPGMPGAIYQPAPKRAEGASRRDWLLYLAPLSIAILQQLLGYLVGNTYFTQLGEYPICWFSDGRVQLALQQFKSDLASAEDKINERNRKRALPYTWVLPSNIPQSTNI